MKHEKIELIDKNALLQTLVKNGWLKMDALKDSAEMIAVQAAIDSAPVIAMQTNAPLTLVELREIDSEEGVPVYTTRNGWLICYGLVSKGDEIYMDVGIGCIVPMADYGDTWLAYRSKPEEGTPA